MTLQQLKKIGNNSSQSFINLRKKKNFLKICFKKSFSILRKKILEIFFLQNHKIISFKILVMKNFIFPGPFEFYLKTIFSQPSKKLQNSSSRKEKFWKFLSFILKFFNNTKFELEFSFSQTQTFSPLPKSKIIPVNSKI